MDIGDHEQRHFSVTFVAAGVCSSFCRFFTMDTRIFCQ